MHSARVAPRAHVAHLEGAMRTFALKLLAVTVATVFAAAIVACGGKSPTDATPTPTPTTNTVTFGNTTATVALAATRVARDQGLMGVTKMATDSGMLFVFADDRQRAFWMKDTPIPLSIAFLDANKKVVFLSDMVPNTTTNVGGFNAPQMRYALEMNQGWFASHSVAVGTYATFTLPSGLVIETDP